MAAFARNKGERWDKLFYILFVVLEKVVQIIRIGFHFKNPKVFIFLLEKNF
jgi:hypothetical protein